MSEEKPSEPLSDFLHAKSMLTPGICGALVMAMTNTLGVTFNLGGIHRGWVCLILSLLAGSLVFAATRHVRGLWLKLVYYVLNSLIIFSTAAGTNSSVQNVADKPAPASAITNTIIITNTLYHTQVVVQVVSNGRTNTKPSVVQRGASVLATNRVPIQSQPLPVTKAVDNKFFERWR